MMVVYWTDSQGNDRPVNVVSSHVNPARTRIQIEPPYGGVHSEEFVTMFLGYLAGDTPELHTIRPPRLLESWEKFKREMGK